ncbi:MAG: nucleotidyltransferase domain-containing protein [Sandaracinaceae bacterium]|nr:nucleotidyltransferase domain-containing protein [Sandaracinaceae bacterium]
MPVPLSATRAVIAGRDAERRARASERAAALRARLPEVVSRLRAYGAREIWLFGSLARGDLHEASDVDLAVDRLSPDVYFAALAAASATLACDVDLVVIDEASPALREAIARDGVPL